MSCSLILDFGNTRDKIAIYEAGVQSWRYTDRDRLDLSELRQICTRFKPQYAILSSTTDERPELREWLHDNMNCFIPLSHSTPVPFKNAYATPQTLGRDRIALVAGARNHIESGPVLVVDAGTCITFDFLDAEQVYHGGAISPGIRMRLEAMHTFTAKLPLVAMEGPPEAFKLIGNSTESSMQSGALHGTAAEVDGIIDRYQAQYENLQVLLTGGDADTLVSLLKNRIFAVRELVPDGLNQILEFNLQS